MEMIASLIFAFALVHTFSIKLFNKWARQFPEGSIAENLLHLLGEVEIVFGLWTGILLIYMSVQQSSKDMLIFLDTVNFTEPLFVFVIMCIAGTRPVLFIVEKIIEDTAFLFPTKYQNICFYFLLLTMGPLMGSLITEPGAMTVTAILLRDRVLKHNNNEKFLYATMGLLFVNISIGGVLTHFAAPPVVMVAQKFTWDTAFMLQHFGYKGIISIVLSTFFYMLLFKKEFQPSLNQSVNIEKSQTTIVSKIKPPYWVIAMHLIFIYMVVITSHHPKFFMGLFLFFIGFITVTKEYQIELPLRSSLLVGFFLAGLVVLGHFQSWWLSPLIQKLGDWELYFATTALTAITDNAALTFLGSQVEGLSSSTKYFLVAGAVTGGGLTVIANAPNPIGYSVLQPYFGSDGVNAIKLFIAALPATAVAIFCFLFL